MASYLYFNSVLLLNYKIVILLIKNYNFIIFLKLNKHKNLKKLRFLILNKFNQIKIIYI